MRRKLFPLFVVCLLCAFSASAQRIDEAGSKIVLGENGGEILLAPDRNSPDFDGAAVVEILGITDKVLAMKTQKVSLKRGQTEPIRFPMTLEELFAGGSSDAAFYRLRYRVGDAGGIIAFSSLIDELFELRVVSSGNVFAGMNLRSRVVAVNPFTGIPLSGVRVKASLSLELKGEDDKKFEAVAAKETDRDGTALFDFPIPPSTELGEDGLLDIVGVKNGVVRGVSADTEPVSEDLQLLMMIDKPIYQPDQVLNIRGVLLKGREMITVAPGKDVEFQVEDEDDKVVYRESVKTSQFGVAAVSWNIPSNAKLGKYNISAQTDDYPVGYESITVSRYDLPNFVVTAKADKPFYLPNEKSAEIEVRADYLFGRNVTRGRVRVVRESSREWNWKEQKYDIEEGETHEGETDSKGVFRAKFDLKSDHEELKADDEYDSWHQFEDLWFAAYFTDLTTNKTEQRRFGVRITREPIHVYFIGERNQVHPDLPVDAYVSAFYADGTPAEADIEIRASEEGEDKFRTIGRARTNSFGVAKTPIRRPNFEDDIDLRIIARDSAGRRGRISKEINFASGEDGLVIETDRTIYKPGEPTKIKLQSTKESGQVFVDVVRGWSVISSGEVDLKGGRGEISVPYDAKFSGVLTVAAYFEDDDGDLVKASRGIIYPKPENLQVNVETEKAVYKPGENVNLGFKVSDSGGTAVESALGIVIRDRAVEERAATDSAFGGGFSGYGEWLGYGGSIGSVNIKDIKEIDLAKPIPPELELVAAALLSDKDYYPEISQSVNFRSSAADMYSAYFHTQFDRVEKFLEAYYLKNNFRHPVHKASLNAILREGGVIFEELTDPWGVKYHTDFEVEKDYDVVKIWTSGPDKRPETADDSIVSITRFRYFTPMGNAINNAIRSHFDAVGDVIRDKETLFRAMGISGLNDRFGRPYLFKFEVERNIFITKILSAGPNGREAKYENSDDDFTVWTNRLDYFAPTEAAISEAVGQAASKPGTTEQFSNLLKKNGINVESILDGYGHKVYVTSREISRFTNRARIENYQRYGEKSLFQSTIITPVTEKVVVFSVRSPGKDNKVGTSDDFTLAEFRTVISEQSKDDPKPKIKQITYSGSTGAVAGKVLDPLGAVIPGAVVKAVNQITGQERQTTTDSEGRFMIINLPAGKYNLRVESPGFSNTEVVDISVTAGSTVTVDVMLNVDSANLTVEVTAGEDSSLISTSSSAISNNVTVTQIGYLPLMGRKALELMSLKPRISDANDEKSTPRLRQYFPETLLWNPELITGHDGRARLDFKLADNITTWKMYAVATTKDGKVGLTDKNITAFQSFFVDLDPPKFLTEGDEISLPTQVRNYTDSVRKVDVSMDQGDWFSFLGSGQSTLNVASGKTENAVFGFKAIRTIKSGTQRVTALAGDQSDSIEKPVTVFPNGQEIVRTDFRFFDGNDRFNIDFPDNTLPGTPQAELKIYPNLRAHVADAVDGLLRRPYGCGEQTVSSTYPNLMILRFAPADAPIRVKALRNLQKGYERLIGYQMPDGGISYWGGRDASDLALTAYTLRFLKDAADFILVDKQIKERAEKWLVSRQRLDGSWYTHYSWEKSEDRQRAKMLTTYITHSLAMANRASASPEKVEKAADNDISAAVQNALAKALAYLRVRNDEIDEPYSIALFGLASLDAGRFDDANEAANRLAKMEIAEGGASYWKLETNTPFNGWGTAGRIETTALVVQLFARLTAHRPETGDDTQKQNGLNNSISRGIFFLLKNKDHFGVWYSTQTTINVLDAFLSTIGETHPDGTKNSTSFTITVNGESMQALKTTPDQIEPLVVDISDKLIQQKNEVMVAGTAGNPVMAQIVSSHYIDWSTADVSGRNVNQSRALRMDYACDKTTAAIMDEVSCSFSAERVGFRGYGMLLAEIGIPPGADVSRESLEAAREKDWSFSRYDVLPDRIVVYLWAKAGGTNIDFKFRPRYAISAQSPSTIVYDYYNPEARAVVAPKRFLIK